MTDYEKEYDELYEEYSKLVEMLNDPSKYRETFMEGTGGEDIFESILPETLEFIINKAKRDPKVKSRLIKDLDLVGADKSTEIDSSARPRFQPPKTSLRLRSAMIYTPRSSSRPVVD